MAEAAPTQLDAQIRSQPEALEHMLIAGTVKAQVHAAAEALHRVRRIWVVGTGTSQHAAFLGAAMLQDAGRSAHAVSSMQFVKNAPIVNQADGVVVITHTGETSYALSARALAVLAGMQTITITREGLGMNDVIETVPKESSETYTVSYTTTLLALGLLAGAMGADSLTPAALELVPGAVRDAIADSGTQDIPLPQRSVQLIGAGQGAITAREGAVKIREAARVLAEGYDVEFFLHGSAVPLGGQDHVVALTHGDDDGLVRAVATTAASEGIGVSLLDEPAALPPLLAQIPLTVRLQLLAARFAAERGQNPDVVITGKWSDPGLWSIGSPEPSY